MARKVKQLPELRDVEITAVAAEGKALARTLLRPGDETPTVVFVSFAAPGDVVDIKLDKKRKSYAEGHVTRLVKPSPIRVEPRCGHFTVCGGCKWQHLPYQEQLKAKRGQVEDAFRRIAKVEIPEIPMTLGSEQQWHYRNKMEYTFSDKKWRTWEEVKSGREFDDSGHALGFHIPGAFDKVLHIDECHLQDSLGDEIRNFIFSYAEEHGLSFYNLKENRGLLRTLMIRIVTTGEVMAVLSIGEDRADAVAPLLQAVKDKFPQITSLLYVVNTKLNDTIGDLDVEVYAGRPYIEEKMEGLTFRIDAKSFYQTNSRQAQRLYEVTRRFAGLDGLKDGNSELPLVYDLYTGTGTIANFVAAHASKVVGIEYVEAAIRDARINSQANGIDNTLFYAGDMKDVLTDDFVADHGVPDVMIVDPPRAGMHEDVVEVIKRARPRVIVYVSCNPATQARDVAMLDDLYEVTHIQPVDMFPHTHHVENVARLQLRDKPKSMSEAEKTPEI